MNRDDTLIRMANQIGTFFESMPERTEALAGIAKHFKNFWDPRMRKAFLAQVDGSHPEAISPIVLEAVAAHRATLE